MLPLFLTLKAFIVFGSLKIEMLCFNFKAPDAIRLHHKQSMKSREYRKEIEYFKEIKRKVSPMNININLENVCEKFRGCFALLVSRSFGQILSKLPRVYSPLARETLEPRFGKDFEVYFTSKLIMLTRISKDSRFSHSRTVIRLGKCRHFCQITGKYFKTFTVGCPTF